jgi:hypothetical protein
LLSEPRPKEAVPGITVISTPSEFGEPKAVTLTKGTHGE